MSRDGSGTYTLPSGYVATTGATIEATQHNTPLQDLETDANTARPIVAGGTGATTASAARDNLYMSGKVLSKSAAYTATANDRSKVIRCSGTWTLSLTVASTLGDGWFVDVQVASGTITIDPDGSETIDGASTLSVTASQSVRITCDGTSFYSSFFRLTEVSEDTTPQLGGALDANGNIVRLSKGADLASATTVTLGDDGNYFDITGTTTITGFASQGVGTIVRVRFTDALTLTHNATSFVLPGGADITTVAGDEAEFVEFATGNWRMTRWMATRSQTVWEAGTDTAPALVSPALIAAELQKLSPLVAFCRFSTDASDNVIIEKSYNISSIVRTSTGDFDVTFANAMNDVNYIPFGNYATSLTPSGGATNDGQVIFYDFTTTTMKIKTADGAGNDRDPDGFCSFQILDETTLYT